MTFIFGGLRIDTDGRVLDTAERPISGLYAAGELFYFNYPGGTGLVSGSVFGKIAGTTAGRHRRAPMAVRETRPFQDIFPHRAKIFRPRCFNTDFIDRLPAEK